MLKGRRGRGGGKKDGVVNINCCRGDKKIAVGTGRNRRRCQILNFVERRKG